MPSVKIVFSLDTIREAEYFKISDPILFALQRATGTLWRISNEGYARETIAPYRHFRLPLEVQLWRDEYLASGNSENTTMPLNFELEFQETTFSHRPTHSSRFPTGSPENQDKETASHDGIEPVEITLRIMPGDWEDETGSLESILLKALERRTNSHWRSVCPSLFVECTEPYNTVVLRHDALQQLREQYALQQECKSNTSPASLTRAQKSFQFKAELYAPLTAMRFSRHGQSSKTASPTSSPTKR
jgi:hypothetical protein